MSVRQPWPRVSVSTLHDDVVEYKREDTRNDGEATSYIVSTVHGLLLGRVWRTKPPRRDWWYTEGWTPLTDGYRFGPYDTRWEAMGGLLAIEERGKWPVWWRCKRLSVEVTS